MVVQLCDYTKYHWVVHLKLVNNVIDELSLNEAFEKIHIFWPGVTLAYLLGAMREGFNVTSKALKPGFNSTWTVIFQMFKLDLEQAEEPDQIAKIRWIIKKVRKFQKNIYFCFVDYAKAFDCVDHNKLWKILQQMGIPDHLTCLLRNLYAGQEATVRTGHGTTDWFQTGKGVPNRERSTSRLHVVTLLT